MSKITAEEAKKALHRLSSIAYMNLEDTLLLDEYIYQNTKNLTPTLDEVVKAWEGILDESDLKSGKKIRVKMIKGSAIIEVFGIWSSDVWASICKINENEIDFNLNISMKNLNAINITIKYLESYKEETK